MHVCNYKKSWLRAYRRSSMRGTRTPSTTTLTNANSPRARRSYGTCTSRYGVFGPRMRPTCCIDLLTRTYRVLDDQQRVTRLHQLHQSVAKLAAAAAGTHDSQLIDPVRARHSRFLVDAMAQREAQHVLDMTRLLLRARTVHPPLAAKY
jgi:hypothetical protein